MKCPLAYSSKSIGNGCTMDLREAIYTRRAVREFTAEPVDEKTLHELIDAAIQAPSAVNQQPWSFCVVRDRALLGADIARSESAYATNLAGGLSHHFQELLSDPNFDIFLSCARADRDFERGGEPVGGRGLLAGGGKSDAGSPRRRVGYVLDRVRAELGLERPRESRTGSSRQYVPVAPIIVGHPKSPPPPVPRKEPEIRWIGS